VALYFAGVTYLVRDRAHDPEITEPVRRRQCPGEKLQADCALAVRRGELARERLDELDHDHGLPGFSPTQGHIASAIPWLPHGLTG
jgi:glycine/sarcosine/betaine reductase complex component C subunit beta